MYPPMEPVTTLSDADSESDLRLVIVCAWVPNGSVMVVSAPDALLPVKGDADAAAVAFWVMEQLLEHVEDPAERPRTLAGLYFANPTTPSDLAEFSAHTGRRIMQYPDICGMILPTPKVWSFLGL